MNKYDDPVWEYVLNAKLQVYIPHVREFWKNISEIEVVGTGVFPIVGTEIPPGLMYRVTNTPVRSPIKNVQVFPFVPVSYLQLMNVAGGSTKMVQRVCADRRFTIDEFTIIEKSNLPSTYNRGQFVAFVPTEMLESNKILGKWIYLTIEELYALSNGNVLKSVDLKIKKYLL